MLPHKWREKELKEGDEVLIIEEQGFLKIIPKKKIDLTQFFDSLEYENDLIEKLDNWADFENTLSKKKYK